MWKIALASSSAIKENALKETIPDLQIFKNINKKIEIVPMKIELDGQCAQPFNSRGGKEACWDRIDWLLNTKEDIDDYKFIIAIENYIHTESQTDTVWFVIYNVAEDQNYQISKQTGIPLPDIPLGGGRSEILESLMGPEYYHKWGATETYGNLYHKLHPEIPADNWMLYTANIDRKDYIKTGIEFMLAPGSDLYNDILFIDELNKCFRNYPDYPKPGVNLLDWSDIFLDHGMVERLIEYLANHYDDTCQIKDLLDDDSADDLEENKMPKIDYVMGLESRGYFLAIPLALRLKAGFVPIKKTGKTPGPFLTKSYRKEYGEDSFDLRSDLLPGNVLIIDDVLATGGSLEAAILLAEEAGHNVVEAITVRDVPSLRNLARMRLRNYPVRVLITD